MYAPEVVAASVARLARAFQVDLVEHSVPVVEEWIQRLDLLWDPETETQKRPFTAEEAAFIANERLMGKASWRYWAERYCIISSQGAGLSRLALWESQELILARLAALELAAREYGQDADGLLVNILKARQLGASTLSQSMVAHRITTQADVFALVAGDVPAQSTYIVDMLLRVLDNLPWWMKPGLKTRIESFPQELEFVTGSHVWGAAGDSTRGENEKKGNIGRGKTPSVLTLTELSTWAHAEQIDGSLMPGVPVHPRTLALFESTAKGMGNWWDKHWQASKRGIGRFSPIFIPWYAEKRKHRLPAPAAWGPRDDTLAHAKRCEEDSSYWLGRRVDLTRDQLYWYEQTRATFKHQGRLHEFLEEYPATDEEAFQVGGIGIFSTETMARLVEQARPLAAVLDVLPKKDIALETAEEQGNPVFELPAGYGFRWRAEIPSPNDLEALEDCLLVWEPPRKNQWYMLSVDVSGGVGADRSVVEVIRRGTVEEPDEQVAEYVSAWLSGRKLALIIDAIGHLYAGTEHEAQVAIENNFGMGLSVQDELQQHLGYTHFWIWRYLDARRPEKRFSTRIGFWTNARTRPMILESFVDAVTTVDVVSGYSDLRLNSPHLFHEMRRFIAPPGGSLAMAEAAPGAHDDCVMAISIGEHCAHTTLNEQGEPLAETRRRLHEEETHRTELAETAKAHRSFQNTPVTAEFVETGIDSDSYGSSLYSWP